MRIFLSSLLILAHLSLLGAALSTHSKDVGSQVDYEVAGGPSDTTEARSWASFLNPSYISQSIQNAYLPPTLRLTSAVQALVAPDPASSDFWDKAKEYGQSLQDNVRRLLESAAAYFKSPKFTDITSAMNNIVHATATFRDNIKGTLDAHHITLDALTKELEVVFMTIVHDLENIPPPSKAPGHAERQEMVDKILDDTELALTNLVTRHGIEAEVVTTYLQVLKPQVQALIVAVGDINEQHPQLLPALAVSVAVMLIPESWILRPLLSMFGFGPEGPIKGSAAAWLQKHFWGAAVKTGSWFSWLQAAGTGVIPKWAGTVIKVPLAIGGGLLAMLLPCLNRG